MTAMPVVCGIYFLLNKRKLIYIGKSKNCYQRIEEHRQNGREFDYACIATSLVTDIDWLEKSFIESLNPPHNKHNRQNESQEPQYSKSRLVQSMVSAVLPRKEKTIPEMMSMTEARTYIGERWRGFVGQFRQDVKSGKIFSIRKGRRGACYVRTSDIHEWIEIQWKILGYKVVEKIA